MSEVGSRFLGPSDFSGLGVRRRSNALNGAQSTYNGLVSVTNLNRDMVKQVLPVNLQLAEPLVSTAEHPVIHLVGHQRSPQQLKKGHPSPLGEPYQEMILLIPFVVRDGDHQWHSFAVRMYLDDVEPILVGNSVYAYSKEFANFTESGDSVHRATHISNVLGALYTCELELKGGWRSANDDALPRWIDLKAIFEMPIVGFDFIRFVCSYWEWEYSAAEVALAASTHRFLRPFRSGMGDWVRLGNLQNATDGSVAIRGLRWRLAFPLPTCLFGT